MTKTSRKALKALYHGVRTMVYIDMDESIESSRKYATTTLAQYIYDAINALMQSDGYDIPTMSAMIEKVARAAWQRESIWMKEHGCPNVERFVHWRYL